MVLQNTHSNQTFILSTMKKFIEELNSFYPAYLQAHNDKGNRILHFIGASLFFILLAFAFILPNYWLIPVAIVVGYILPGIGHRFYQNNDSFRSSKPVICVICAFRMYIDMITFRINQKSKTVDNGAL